MSELPTITIITPVLNGAQFIKKAIDSVLAQHYPRLEYIVMDAGSSDGTVEILRQYGQQIKLVCDTKDKGVYDAYNKALQIAQGDIIGMLSADDWLSPHTLLRVGQRFADNPNTDVVSVGTQLHYLTEKEHTITPGEIFNLRYYSLDFKTICELPLPNSRFIKTSVYQYYGFFPESEQCKNYFLSADLELMLRLASKSLTNSVDETVGYNFLVHANSLTAGNNWNNKLAGLAQKITILKDFLQNNDLNAKQKQIIEHALQRNTVYIIVISFLHSKKDLAKEYYNLACKRYGYRFFIIFLKILLVRTRREYSILRRYFSLGWSKYRWRCWRIFTKQTQQA